MIGDDKDKSPRTMSVSNGLAVVSNPGDQDSRQEKPKVDATPGDRRQRNRQAQATFLARRMAYTRQLENTVHLHKKTILALQTANRTAQQEISRLRHRNSVLESALPSTSFSKACHSQTAFPFVWHSSPSLGVETPTDLQEEISNATFPSTYTSQSILQSSLTAGHHQPQLFSSRIAPHLESLNPSLPPHPNTRSCILPTATLLNSSAIPANIAMSSQQTGTYRQEIAAVQGIQQSPQPSLQQMSVASELSFDNTPCFQSQAGQSYPYAQANGVDSFGRGTTEAPDASTSLQNDEKQAILPSAKSPMVQQTDNLPGDQTTG